MLEKGIKHIYLIYDLNFNESWDIDLRNFYFVFSHREFARFFCAIEMMTFGATKVDADRLGVLGY